MLEDNIICDYKENLTIREELDLIPDDIFENVPFCVKSSFDFLMELFNKYKFKYHKVAFDIFSGSASIEFDFSNYNIIIEVFSEGYIYVFVKEKGFCGDWFFVEFYYDEKLKTYNNVKKVQKKIAFFIPFMLKLRSGDKWSLEERKELNLVV